MTSSLSFITCGLRNARSGLLPTTHYLCIIIHDLLFITHGLCPAMHHLVIMVLCSKHIVKYVLHVIYCRLHVTSFISHLVCSTSYLVHILGLSFTVAAY